MTPVGRLTRAIVPKCGCFDTHMKAPWIVPASVLSISHLFTMIYVTCSHRCRNWQPPCYMQSSWN